MKRLKIYFILILLSIFLYFLVLSEVQAQNLSDFDWEKLFGVYYELIEEAKSGKADLAIAKLNAAIQLNPENFPRPEVIVLNRFIALYYRGLIRLNIQGFYNEAIRDFNTAFEMSGILKTKTPLVIQMLGFRSAAYYAKGDYIKAVNDISEAIKICETYKIGASTTSLSALYSQRGKYYSAKGDFRKALTDYRKAIELGSKEDYTFWGLAYALHKIGQKENARFFLNQILVKPLATDSGHLDKPISLKTKAFISKRIKVAANYIIIPEDMLLKALVYLNAYSGDIGVKKLTKNIQKLLRDLGYDPGPIDGVVGSKTRYAIRTFQADHKIPVDGQASEEIYHRLTIALRELTRLSLEKPKEDLPYISYGSIPNIVTRIRPAIVKIIAINMEKKLIKSGSGFFIKNNLIITNNHVIEKSTSIRVKTHDGKLHKINKIMVKDRSHDLAIVELGSSYDFQIKLPLNKDPPRVGERILVIGNPFGLELFEQTVSDGIISAIRKVRGKLELIQITAPISPGSSGGPVVNLKGEVIGVATLYFTKGQNLNFAVSSKHISKMIDSIK